MFLSFFKEHRQARVQAIEATLSEFIVVGEGEWHIFSRTPLGVPILRLYRSASEAGPLATKARLLLTNEIPSLPSDFPPWLPQSVVRSQGPFISGHCYRRKNVIGRSSRSPAFLEVLDLEFIERIEADEYLFKVVEDRSRIADLSPDSQPALCLRPTGSDFEMISDEEDFSDFSYLAPRSQIAGPA